MMQVGQSAGSGQPVREAAPSERVFLIGTRIRGLHQGPRPDAPPRRGRTYGSTRPFLAPARKLHLLPIGASTYVSRCKAEGGGKKSRGGVAPGRARRSRPRLDQANREAARLSPSRKFYAVAMTGIVSRRAFASLLDRAGLTSQVILRRDDRRAGAADAPYVFAEIPREAGIDHCSSPASSLPSGRAAWVCNITR